MGVGKGVGVTNVAVGRATVAVGSATGFANNEQEASRIARRGENFFIAIIIVFSGL